MSFVLFAILVLVMVGISFRQNINLVSKEYYKQELVYQDQIERVANTEALPVKPVIEVNTSEVIVYYSDLARVDKGMLKLFRPSDEHLDQTFQFTAVEDSVLRLLLKPPVPGLYRVQLLWSMDDKEYYLEMPVNL